MPQTTDPRVADWPLMSSMASPIAWITNSLLVIFICTSEFRSREPYITAFRKMFDPIILVLNTILTLQMGWYILQAKYFIFCQTVNYTGDPAEDKIAELMWYFLVLKIFEFGVNTVICRIKEAGDAGTGGGDYIFDTKEMSKWCTFLQIYRRLTLIMITWLAVQQAPGGTAAVLTMVNSFSNVILYLYFNLKVYGFLVGDDVVLLSIPIVAGGNIVQCVISVTSLVFSCGFPEWLAFGYLFYSTNFLLWCIPLM